MYMQSKYNLFEDFFLFQVFSQITVIGRHSDFSLGGILST